MATTSRELDPDVKEALFDLLKQEPFRVSFFQAVRLLRRLLPDRKPVGYFLPPATEAVRFVANPSLDFPASEIQSMEWPESYEKPVKMSVNFMGLSSPLGVLPAPYTELIIERALRKDNGFRDFLDIFNHRLISLMYRAWEKHHFFAGYERKEIDQLTPLLLSFIGLQTEGLTGRQDVSDQTFAFYAGILAQQPRSAQGLRQMLADYFQVPVEVEQFAGKWVRLLPQDQACFDDNRSLTLQLGCGAVIGDEMWDQQSTVRVKLGPLTQTQYMDFLPRPEAKAYPELKALLKFYANDNIDFELQLILEQEEVPRCELQGDGNDNLLLGWMTWIKNVPLGRDPGETVLQMWN